MEKTLAVLNQLEAIGLIGRYAIGGAIAATRYVEPVQTYDLDIFTILPVSSAGLISLTPIYDYLRGLGYIAQGEGVVIEDWPVQFLPVYDALIEEALAQAVEVNFGLTPTRVLAAIMLNTGRPKDYARLSQFFEFNALNKTVLAEIVAKHDLTAKWQNFRERFLNEKD